MWSGVSRRTLNYGEHTSIHEIRMARGSVVPPHTHPHEQTGYLVSGRMLIEMPGLRKELAAGDSWLIPGGVEHSATAREDALFVDVFSPAREEYRD